MGKLILLRHGETAYNVEKLYFGRLNPPLNKTGIIQSKQVREILKDIEYDFIYSSPLLRAKETAEICNYLNLPINYSDSLQEINFGILEGLTFKKVKEKYPDVIIKMENEWKTYNFETGEAPIEMYKRTLNFLKTLNFNKNNLIVSHWGILNCILCHYLTNGLDGYWKFKLNNCGIAILEGNFDFCYLTKLI